MRPAAAALAAMTLPAARGQSSISATDANGEHTPGGVAPNEPASIRFRLRNASDAPALFSALELLFAAWNSSATAPVTIGTPGRTVGRP